MIAGGGGQSNVDRAGRAYWDGRWSDEPLPSPINPEEPSIWNHVNRKLTACLTDAFGAPGGRRLLEVGCGNSVWLPYFARLGFAAHGIDYSPQGCEGVRVLLEREGVSARVHCADLFDPPAELSGTFDAVVSFGVVEHFDDTDGAVRSVASFLSPDGVMFTLVPNMNGMPGLVQRSLNRPVYDAHVPLTPKRLGEAHVRAGLELISSKFFLAMNFGVNNLHGCDPGRTSTKVATALLKGLTALGASTWWVDENLGVHLPATRMFSPYVVTIARLVGEPGPEAMQ